MKSSLTTHDKISLAMHDAVKRELLSDPQRVVMIGKQNLERWKKLYGYEPAWMSEWASILEDGVPSIIPVLEGLDEHSILLRSSSPFAGVISQKERKRIIHVQRSS